MFTGLIEGMGIVREVIPEAGGLRFVIAPPEEMSGNDKPSDGDRCRLGDSVAISGCCLTVVDIANVDISKAGWSFQAGAETLAKTNLGRLKPGDPVNLERSLPVNGRLGGHFVQGHVDGTGVVDAIDRDADWVTMAFRVSPALARLMVPKGSVAVDGISLTVVTVDADRFTVALIPHTLTVTTLGRRTVGDTVNIETDILGKYVQKLLMKE